MKRLISIILVSVALLAVISGCTRNNGGEPILYGNWKLYDVQFKNFPQTPAPDENWFWAFQNTTVAFTRTNSEMSSDQYFATYRLDDNTLILDFKEQKPPMGLPTQCTMQLVHHGGGKLEFIYNPTPYSEVIYRLKKW